MAADITLAAPIGTATQPSSFAEFWASFRENKGAVAGLVVLSLIVFVAIFADFLAPHSPLE
ncbi:MAG: dipeptide ABC transporter permease DppC, partial [Hyphomicrobiales bacterium]|nr:dipeptide ABC transporter permease DppC [Hyphomicrobiales bacterium]